MKHLLLTISLIFGATAVSAKDTLMQCEQLLFKFSEGLYSTKVFIRSEAEWKNWCRNDIPEVTKTLKITDKGAVCLFERLKEKQRKSYVDFLSKEYVTTTGLRSECTILK